MSPKVATLTVEETIALQAARIRHLESLEHGIEPFSAHLNNPCARVYHNAAQTIANDVWTALDFNSERFDTDTIHDTVVNNSRLYARTAGVYQISGTIQWAANNVGQRGIGIRRNGAAFIASHDRPEPSYNVLAISTLYELSVGDYVELMVYQTSGGNLNVSSVANSSPEFMMARVG